MVVKRKSAVIADKQPKEKVLKTKKGSDKSLETHSQRPKPSKKRDPSISSEDEFAGFDSDKNDVLSGEDSYSDLNEDDFDEAIKGDDVGTEQEEDVEKPIPKQGVTKSDKPSHAEQRALAKERKLSKPNAQKLYEARKIWEAIRVRAQSKVSRQIQVDKLYSLINGGVSGLVFEHSASRFVQAVMKYGTPEQRNTIVMELKGRYIELAKSKYGKFLVGKILEYGNVDLRNLVVGEFIGSIGKLISHKEAGVVVNDIYRDICTPAQKLEVLQELYGPEFRLFKTSKPVSLKEILTEHPEKKEQISKSLIEMLKGCVKKDIINLDLVHTVLLQALQISLPKQIEELISLFKDQIHQLAHTKDGGHAACLLISYGTAKDRKNMVKSIRDIVLQMAMDQYGHTVIIAICAVVDDTKLVSKAVLGRFNGHWHDLIRHKWGNKLLSFLCRETKDPLVIECREKAVNTSKKVTENRRKELMQAVSEDLLCLVANEANDLMRDPVTSQIVQEILLSAEGGKSKATDAVISLASGDPTQENHIIRLPFTARIYKTLVQVLDCSMNFAGKLCALIQSEAAQWAMGEGSFVVVALLESLSGKEKDQLVARLKQSKSQLKSLGEQNKGTKIVLEKIG